MTKASLPQYAYPPLREVAISVQFAPLAKLVVPEIGLLWQHYGERFKHVEQHPPIEPQIERFGVKARPVLPRLELMARLPLPRIWFLDEAKRELLQIQQDRFVRNWRKVDSDASYPRYEKHLRPKFLEDYQDFISFIERNDIGEVKPNQCELTYINLIQPNHFWDTHADIGKVFTVVSNEYAQSAFLQLEDANVRLRHFLLNESGERIGRLYIEISPAVVTETDETVFELKLIARGHPSSSAVESVVDFIDRAREAIVRSFDSVTRKEMHAAWGKDVS